MRKLIPVLIVLITALLQPAFAVDQEKRRIFVVSSYHKEYLWSQSTQQGLVRAMRDYGYLDTDEQGETFTHEDYVESSTAVIPRRRSVTLASLRTARRRG